MTPTSDSIAKTSATVTLSFPETHLVREVREGKEYALDPVRRSFVRLTPEERVRQHALAYLIDSVGVPPGLISVEKGFIYNGMQRRADIVVFDRRSQPLIVVECKSPGVAIDQSVFDQVSRYNTQIRAPYVIVTNGIGHYCFVVDFGSSSVDFIAALPRYDALHQH